MSRGNDAGKSGTVDRQDNPMMQGVNGDGQPGAMAPSPADPTAQQVPPAIAVPSYTGGITLAGKVSPLVEYNKLDYQKATAEGKLIVLYFCSNFDAGCKKEMDTALYPIFNQLRDRNVVGFRVNTKDTDTDADELALAKEFSVTVQNTKVLVKGGVVMAKSSEVWDKKRYEAEISNAIVR